MKELRFLEPGDGIGITAPSDGNSKLTDFARLENGKMNLEERDYLVRETANVRSSVGGRSSDAKTRAEEFMSLVEDPAIQWIVCAKGGDFLLEMLPYLDFEKIGTNPKWVQGYSDNTGILYPMTTLLDIPTVYGCNFNDFGMLNWHPALTANLEILEGKRLEQESFDFYEADFQDRVTGLEDYVCTEPVVLKALTADGLEPEAEREIKGRLLGGCMDVLLDLVGTPYDGTKGFLERHKGEPIIWYLETFALSAERLTMGLWRMRQAGWFEGAAGFVFGRPCFFRSDYGSTFEEAVEATLGDLGLPIITGADIGHRAPQMTMINGFPATFTYHDGKGKLTYEFTGTSEDC